MDSRDARDARDARGVTDRFLARVESRDLDALLACFAPDASWQNVPHPPAQGIDAIRAVFGFLWTHCEAIRWDVVSAAYTGDTAWLERVDRFWIAGREYAIECHGVFRVDPARGLLTSVRDYVDLGVWRSRLAEAGISR